MSIYVELNHFKMYVFFLFRVVLRQRIEKNKKKSYFVYQGRGVYMKITYSENAEMNHYEMKLMMHPKNKKLAKLLVKQFQDILGEIEVYDEYRNKYPITLLEVYYFEMVDHKIFVYTEKEVYRLYYISMGALKEKLTDYGFYQINVRTLVNVKHVVHYKKQVGCRRQMILDNGDILISSRHFKEEFDMMMESRSNVQLLKKDQE